MLPPLPKSLANRHFATPMTGPHVRRVFDEQCWLRLMPRPGPRG